MMHKAPVLFSLVALSLPLSLQAATSKPANLADEYEQVRKIAARDPKVRAAYEDADRRLAAKIAEIDPALKGYTPGKTPVAPAHSASVPAAKPATAKKPAPAAAPAKAHGTTHTVVKGETLGGIAARYHVSTAALKTTNHITDERKLAVGQKLVIPGGKSEATAKPVSAKPAPAKSESFWDKLKL